METLQIIVLIAQGLLSVAGFLFWKYLTSHLKRIEAHDNEIKNVKEGLNKIELKMKDLEIDFLHMVTEVKTNYNTKFAEQKEISVKHHEEQLKGSYELRGELIEHLADIKNRLETQVGFCKLVQESKLQKTRTRTITGKGK